MSSNKDTVLNSESADAALRSEINKIFRRYMEEGAAPFFEHYFKERIPEEERLGTARVMNRTLERLKKSNMMPSKESLYSQIFDLANYSYGEWWFAIRDLPNPERRRQLANAPRFVDSVASRVSLKFTILVRGVRQGKLRISSLSPYSPVNTALKALLVLLINLNTPQAQNDPQKSLLFDLYDRIFRKAHGTLKMLSMGLGNDAYASWRTLHEAECILFLLDQGGPALCRAYVQHIVYNNAYRGTITDKAQVDEIFLNMKAEMKAHDLKAKDIKKFIEYGWLYSSLAYQRLADDSKLFNRYAVPVPAKPGETTLYRLGKGPDAQSADYEEFQARKGELSTWDHDKLKDFKLNFRDGIEMLAGLNRYSEWYETASEVTHSSAIFFYANDQFFFDLSTVALYQLSLRVTRMFRKTMSEAFAQSPQTAEMVDRLYTDCCRMLSDQEQRFRTIYGVAVVPDEDSAHVKPSRLEGNSADELPYGAATPGPILKEEEDKGWI